MSSITTTQGSVHYEVHGRGQPVLLLHGWLGSWGLWQKTMAHLHSNYRTYALDFWGFGESEKKRTSYQINDFVDLVDQFMDQLGISHAPIIGHSMGGTVSLSVAKKYPHRVSKVGVIGSPITGDSLSFFLKLAGKQNIAKLVHNAPWILKLGIQAAAPIITTDKSWAKMINKDLSKTTLDSFLSSIQSLRSTDLRDDLPKIDVPMMGMYGAKDKIVNPNQKDFIESTAPRPRMVYYTDAGHFPMLDKPAEFMSALKNFLDND